MVLKDLWLVLNGRLSSKLLRLVEDSRDIIADQRDKLWDDLLVSKKQRDSLTTTLLAIDEELSRIQQCSSWAQMQPIFNRLWDGAERRRQHVSKQIGEREMARIKAEFVAKDYHIPKTETDRMIEEAKNTGRLLK